MVAEWYCQVMGSEVGPLTQRELVDMVRNHRINPEDLVRRNKSSWVAAFEVKGLFEAAAKPPSSKPPSSKPSSSATPRSDAPHPGETRAKVSSETSRVREDKAHPYPEPLTKPASKPGPSKVTHVDSESQSADDWFCIASGEKKGPLGFGELQAMATDGSLRGRDRVWRAAWPKFQQATDVDGLDV